MKNSIFFVILFAFMGLVACNNDKDNTTTSYNEEIDNMENVDMDEEISASLDEQPSMQPYSSTDAVERTAGQQEQDRQSTTQAKARAKSVAMKAFYQVDEVDTPALFNEKCAIAADPMQCSYEELAAYIQKKSGISRICSAVGKGRRAKSNLHHK